MNARIPHYIFPLFFLPLLLGCGAEEPREGSLPIAIREPREVAPVAENPRLASVNGSALAAGVIDHLTNILAKYEIAADRYEVAVDGDAVQDERARLRQLANAWFAQATRDGLEVPARPAPATYRSTERLNEVAADRFRAAFTDAVARDKRLILDLLDTYDQQPLPENYRALVAQLRERL